MYFIFCLINSLLIILLLDTIELDIELIEKITSFQIKNFQIKLLLHSIIRIILILIKIFE